MCFSLLFFTCFIILLTHPAETTHFVLDGLTQWATSIVPTLFPFMVLNSIMIQSGLDNTLVKFISPVLKPFFPYCTFYGLYVIIIGFFCGFPMGAKTVSELYLSDKITAKEANYLLAFCNNIGPAYFLGLIVPMIKELPNPYVPLYLLGMYGIPLAYGIILGFYLYAKTKNSKNSDKTINKWLTSSPDSSKIGLYPFQILKNSCLSSTQSIISLGAYIAIISSFRTLPYICPILSVHKSLIYIILEINSGIKAIYETNEIIFCYKIFIIMTALSFSGISCFLQTACFITGEDKLNKISFKGYCLHRIVMTLVSSIYYFIILIY